MKKSVLFVLQVLVLLAVITSACGTPTAVPQPTSGPAEPTPTRAAETAVPTETPAEDLLYINLTWHQHQPLYYKNADGVVSRPWVRAHATKDYYDMAAVVGQYPEVHVTFNLTPVLIRQLEDFIENGTKDLYWVLAEKPAAELSEADKRFILERFFDANWDHIIARFPRYQELLDLRGGTDAAAIDAALETFSEQDFRDLQVWFNLAWFDPDFLAEEPLKNLVEKGTFEEADKVVLFDQVREVIAGVIPLHKQLQDQGQIEVITTPYAHPILPLIIDSSLALEGAPSADMPPSKFSAPYDALAHLERSVEIYQEYFGQAPKGLWPGEGSVAQAIVPFVAKAGYQFMQTGEPVLAKSLGIDNFTRDSQETVVEADELYRPYYVQDKSGNQVAVFFRDGVLSDKLGFTYSGTPGKAAAQDLINRLENIRARLKEQGAEGPHIVSIILDGENAWEYYDNDGKEFFHNLYQMLSDSQTLKTVTPSEYLEMFPEQRSLENLFAGAWFSPNYDTWIGEAEENQAWDYLTRVRRDLSKYDVQKVRQASPEQIAQAQDFMYLAEGSDWFWWYGADQDSGVDSYFDIGFRELLRSVYTSLGEEVPTFVDVPIIQPQAAAPETPLSGLSTPVADGQITEGEWDSAAFYPAADGPAASGLGLAMDAQNLYVRVDPAENSSLGQVEVYFAVPRAQVSAPFALKADESAENRLIGISAHQMVAWNPQTGLTLYNAQADGTWQAVDPELAGRAVAGAGGLEMAIPLGWFGELQAGDEVALVALAGADGQALPAGGPAEVVIPDLGLSTLLLEVTDPEGDDHGPGSYTYATDPLFQNKAYDIQSFTVSEDENSLIFKVTFYGPVPNPWGSPNGLAIQTIDVYIDQDPGAGTGARLLLPGRNAALAQGSGWEYAVWAEGWTPQVLQADPEAAEPKQVSDAQVKILADPGTRTVLIRVPKSTFGAGDPAAWGYAVAVLGQEGYPSSGVWRVRDVEAQAAQYRFGGAPADSNHTRIMDLVWPADAEGTQEEMLSTYPTSSADVGTLAPDDFAQIQVLQVQ